MEITALTPSPKDFLPQDNYICKDPGKVLKPVTDSNTYLWSNNATSGSIVINQAHIQSLGQMIFQTTDKNKGWDGQLNMF